MLMDLPYATFYPAEKTPENPKGYIDGEFHVFWKEVRTTTTTTHTSLSSPRRQLCPSDSHTFSSASPWTARRRRWASSPA